MQFRRNAIAPCLGLVLLMVPALAQAQQYQFKSLVSNQLLEPNIPTIDPLLANPWGLARSAGSPWWIADNDTGWSTV